MKEKIINGKLGKFLKNHASLLVVIVLISVVLSIVCPNFGKMDNMVIIIRQLSMNVLISLGVTMVMIAGGIDLSVGGIFAITGISVAMLLTNTGLPIWLVLIVGLLIGAIFGFINGFLASYTNIPPFIITLGMGFVASGLAFVIGDGRSVSVIMPQFNALGNGTIGILPIPVIYMLVIAIILGMTLSRTKLGRGIYAVGSNITAAQYSAININKIKLLVFTISGTLAAFSGILNTAKVFVAQPDSGSGNEIDAIAAVVIGGTSFEGGKGTIIGTILGCLLITIIGNGMNHLGINYFWQKVVKGLIILLAVYIDDRVNTHEKRVAMAGGAK